jgi:hypothetical protein
MENNQKKSALPETQVGLKELEDTLAGKNGFVKLGALLKFMREETPQWKPPVGWKVLKTFTILNGLFKSVKIVESILTENKMEIFGRALTMAKKLNFRRFKSYPVDIVMIDITDLGFDESQEVSFKEIVKTAKRKGLEECTPYDAFGIRLAYKEQPPQERFDEWHIVVMRTISNGMFWIMNTHGNFWIGSIYPHPDTMYNKYAKFFFRLTYKK